ncbi:hypothetical protein C4585_00895 [Candidatus Parcubacteria bacterium]|nr:MAG: hypothetical protein C4585_00895 [Candidatus Parcubacteria bacterium]
MEGTETLSSLIAWSIFTGAALFTVLAGLVLAYHWFRYSFNKTVSLIALAIYGTVSFAFLSFLFVAALEL